MEQPPEPVKPVEPIASQEEPQETPLPDEVSDDEPTLILEPEPETEPAFTTAIYVALGLNVCPLCGDKKRVGTDGERICSANREDCPSVNSHPS